MKKTYLIMLAAPLLGLTGCSTMCNKDAAYSQGINDARQGTPMNSDYAAFCSTNVNKEALNREYRHGYKFGLKNQPTQINIKTNIKNR